MDGVVLVVSCAIECASMVNVRVRSGRWTRDVSLAFLQRTHCYRSTLMLVLIIRRLPQ